MFKITIKSIGTGIVATSLLACATSAFAQTHIKVAVAANFATPLNEVITGFKTANPTYSGVVFDITSGATGDFQTAIQTDINDGSISTYDVFIAADDIAPAALRTYEFNTRGTHTLVGTPFFYAHGYSVLWSKTGPNVSAGIPNPNRSVYPYMDGEVAIANPATAPYGKAAADTMLNQWAYTYSNSSTDIFSQFTNIGNTFNAIVAGTGGVTMGFVAKSQVCLNGSWSQTGTFHQYAEGSNYTKLIQHAVVLTRTGTGVDATARSTFATYLGHSIAGVLNKYCYSTTP